MDHLRTVWGLTTAVAERVVRHGQAPRASQFAYVAFLASLPFIFVLVSIIGLVGSPADYTRIVDNVRGTIPDQLADLLDQMLQSASSSESQSILFLLVGLLTGLWMAGNVVGCMTDGFNDALGRPHRPWLRGKARGIAFAVVTALVFVLATFLAVVGPGVVRWALDHVGASRWSQILVQIAAALVGAAIFWGFLIMFYRYASNERRVPVRAVLVGAGVGVVGWFIVANLFRIYVDNFDSYNRVYGGLGVVVVLLVSLFLTGLMILVGGETIAELHDRGEQVA
ncbi:MAG: YihY/virulence factor BrkB family protein [Thermoleophilia bacterium]|nr:YihY/virulence factor BrkB family protein [Thermoleophilia bacterium]